MTRMHTDGEKDGRTPAWRPMTELERRACVAVDPVLIRIPRLTGDIHNARRLASMALRPQPTIRQDWADTLWDLVRRYGGQVVDAEVAAEAEKQKRP